MAAAAFRKDGHARPRQQAVVKNGPLDRHGKYCTRFFHSSGVLHSAAITRASMA
jgi:hypothetical protein